jgi:hypothetical protein
MSPEGIGIFPWSGMPDGIGICGLPHWVSHPCIFSISGPCAALI